jgi:hypothetical protein
MAGQARSGAPVHPAVRVRPVGAGHPGDPTPGLEHREYLHEIEGLGDSGHDRAPLLVELGGLLRDQRATHPRRRSVGERR